VAIHTWSANAITEKDFALAAEIESVSGSESDAAPKS
jgi:pterin-4a-carbinolamine dehydratase